MKKMIVFMIVLLLFSSTHVTTSPEPLRILVDESRALSLDELFEQLPETVEVLGITITITGGDWRYSFENTESSVGFGTAGTELQKTASLDIKKSGKISYHILKAYDVLIIASFTESYSTAEALAIRKFVENGGGLLLLASSSSELNSSVSEQFGVSFPSVGGFIRQEKDKGSTDNVYIADLVSHPVTEGVNQILLNDGVAIGSYTSGEVLARTGTDSWADGAGEELFEKDEEEEEGPFDILLVQSVGKGRVVVFGGNGSFDNYTLKEPDHQNLDLLTNAVHWLGESGGPYKQYKQLNEKAQQALSDALSLYEEKKFSQAKTEFDKATDFFTESNEIYPNPEAAEGITEVQSYVPTLEIGVKADSAFDEAAELYENQEYEKAIEAYEKAKALYEEIECTERAHECDTKVQQSSEFIALRNEAAELFEKGEKTLERAPSILSTAGYEEARSLFEESEKKWEDYHDPAHVQACKEKITLCDREIAKIERTRLLIIGAMVGIGVLLTLIMRKRKPVLVATDKILPEGEGIESLS